MRDLQSKSVIVMKGLMFLFIALAAATLILGENPSVRTMALLVFLVWSSCRFYYFLFYVLEKYVDPNFRYAGLLALVGAFRQKRRRNGGA